MYLDIDSAYVSFIHKSPLYNIESVLVLDSTIWAKRHRHFSNTFIKFNLKIH